MDSAHQTRVHQISFLRNGHTWRLQWDSGDEPLLIDTLAALVADPTCPLDDFDQRLVQQHIHPSGNSSAHMK